MDSFIDFSMSQYRLWSCPIVSELSSAPCFIASMRLYRLLHSVGQQSNYSSSHRIAWGVGCARLQVCRLQMQELVILLHKLPLITFGTLHLLPELTFLPSTALVTGSSGSPACHVLLLHSTFSGLSCIQSPVFALVSPIITSHLPTGVPSVFPGNDSTRHLCHSIPL